MTPLEFEPIFHERQTWRALTYLARLVAPEFGVALESVGRSGARFRVPGDCPRNVRLYAELADAMTELPLVFLPTLEGLSISKVPTDRYAAADHLGAVIVNRENSDRVVGVAERLKLDQDVDVSERASVILANLRRSGWHD